MTADPRAARARREPGLLRQAPGFRRLWLSRVVSFTGVGAGQTALLVLAARSGPATVSEVLLANALPRLLGPLAGAVADRADQRRLLAACEAGQGVVYAVVAAARPAGASLLALVAAAGLLGTLFTPAGKSSVPRLVAPARVAQANALLGAAFNLQIVGGPVIGGLLAGLAGPQAAFWANAAAFFASALLLSRLGPLPPARPDGARPGRLAGVMAETWQGLRHTARAAAPRALVAGTAIFVSFAAIDNVALVFLVKRDLHAPAGAYGAAVAAFGAGMMGASVCLSRWARKQPPGVWLTLGVAAGAAGAVGTGLAPTLPLAAAAQALAGAGNTADLVGTDTMVLQVTPEELRGRVFGAVASAAQFGSSIAYVAGGALVAAAGPRTTFLVAGGGMLAGLAALRPAITAGRNAAATGQTQSL